MADVMVEVGGKQYQVIKTGRAQAEQVIRFSRWVARHGSKAMQAFQSDENSEGIGGGIEFFGRLVEYLDADALIDLFVVLIGCQKEDAEVYFDIAILVDVAIETYEKQESIRKLADRFFSSGKSKLDLVEESMTSE